MIMMAMHPIWIVFAVGCMFAAVPLIALWRWGMRNAEGGMRNGEADTLWHPPSAPSPGAMTEADRASALRTLLDHCRRFGDPAFTIESIRGITGMSEQQAVGFMGWAHGVYVHEDFRTFRCVVQAGAMGTRWIRFKELQGMRNSDCGMRNGNLNGSKVYPVIPAEEGSRA